MSEQFYTILTNAGKAKIANAIPTGTIVNLTTLKVGDSNGAYYNPSESQTSLVHSVYTCNVTSVDVDEANPNWITITSLIPSDVGGFMIREAGVYDSAGALIAIGKYPETYKPVAADGSTKELYIKMTLEITNASSVELKIDPTVIIATKKDINVLTNSIASINSQLSNIVQQNAVNINVFSNLVVDGDWQPAIQSAIDTGRTVLIPQVVEVNNTIIWDGKVDIIGLGKAKSIIKAKTGFIGTILETNSGQTGASRRKFGTLRDFAIDGNFSATKCLHLKNGEGLSLKNLALYQATETVLEVGIDASNVVNASHFENLLLAGDLSYLIPLASFPNYCLKINESSTDNNFVNIFGYDSKLAIFYDNGGQNRFVECHGWGTLANEKFAQYIFKFTSTASQAIGCFADSPKLSGFYLQGWGHHVIASKCIIYNSSGNQTGTTYVEIAESSGEMYIDNNRFWYTGIMITNDIKINTSYAISNYIGSNRTLSSNPNLNYYSKFKYPIFSGNSTYTFTFPVPLSSTNYMIEFLGDWDFGTYKITSKTVNGFTISFTNATTQQQTAFIKLTMFP